MISKDYEQGGKKRRGRSVSERRAVLLHNRVAGMTITRARHEIPPPPCSTRSPRHSLGPHLSSMPSAHPAPARRRFTPPHVTSKPARDVLLTVVVAFFSSGYMVLVLRPLSLGGSGRGAHGACGQGGYRGWGREAVLTPRARGFRGLGEEEKRRSERSE